MKEIPVYLFTGFLESGKTTFIQDVMEDEYFNEGEKTLIMLCEEGEAELEPKAFAFNNVIIKSFDNPQELSESELELLEKKYNIEKVIIEYNGMWQLADLVNSTPENWTLYQNMMFADAGSFLNFNNNMRELVADKLRLCDAVVFNRFKANMDKNEFHNIVRTFNRRADIMYEYGPNHVEQDDIEDPLPYDMSKDEIVVEDDDYAVWYRDVNEETSEYEGKIVNLKGRSLTGGGMAADCFAIGRHVMTCCVDDIEFCGVVCRSKDANKVRHGVWYDIKAKITEEVHETYGGEMGPVLNVIEFNETSAPEEEVAVFY